MTEKVIVWRDQLRIDSQRMAAESVLPALQNMTNEAMEIGIQIESGQIQSASKNPQGFAKKNFTKLVPDELYPGEAKINAIDLGLWPVPDSSKFVKAASEFATRTRSVPVTFFKIVEGKASVNEEAFQEYVEGCTIYTESDAEKKTWNELNIFFEALNRINEYGRSAFGFNRMIDASTFNHYSDTKDGKFIPNLGAFLSLTQNFKRK